MSEGTGCAAVGSGWPARRTSDSGLVGRRHELSLLRQALTLRRPVLLLGPPGVSKTTLLQALAGPADADRESVHWVTGDEQLTAHVLVGTFDPSLVLREGYRPQHFWPGPLVEAMRDGAVLYVEELNRAPAGALNALISALSEGYVGVPHLGRVYAADGFLVVGSANPLDDVGTGRLSRGLLDRFLVLEMGYQPRPEEIRIVLREAPAAGERLAAFAVDLVRATREHPDFRHGASIRAAIDLVNLLAGQADALRDEAAAADAASPTAGTGTAGRGAAGTSAVRTGATEQSAVAGGILLRCLVCAAFTGRVRLRPTVDRSACDVVMDLFAGLLRDNGQDVATLLVDVGVVSGGQEPSGPGGGEGDVPGDPTDLARRNGRDTTTDSDEVPGVERSGAGGEPGRSRSVPMTQRAVPMTSGPGAADLDTADDPLADFAQTVRKAAELVLRVRGALDGDAAGATGGVLRSTPWRAGEPGELDVAATVANYAANGGLAADGDLRVLRRVPQRVDHLVLVDHSGSMAGRKLSLAAVLAAVVAQISEHDGGRYGVLAFDERVTSVKELDDVDDVRDVVERILLLPEGRATDLSLALRGAVDRTADLAAAQTVLVSDCMPTRGATTFSELAALTARVPSLQVCYLDDGQPVIELYATGVRLNLYEWWARRWVGDDRVHTVHHVDDLDRVIDGLSADGPRT